MGKIKIALNEETMDALTGFATERNQDVNTTADQVVTAGLMSLAGVSLAPSPEGAGLLTPAAVERISKYARDHKMSMLEAADYMVKVSVGRLQALTTYNDKQKAKKIAKEAKAEERRKAKEAQSAAPAKIEAPVAPAPVAPAPAPAPAAAPVASKEEKRAARMALIKEAKQKAKEDRERRRAEKDKSKAGTDRGKILTAMEQAAMGKL